MSYGIRLAQEPSLHEVDRALGKLRNGKAPGSTNILPEMVKAGRGNEYFKQMLLDLESKLSWQECLEPVLDVVARTTSIVFDLMQCFASDSHDTVAVMFRCV